MSTASHAGFLGGIGLRREQTAPLLLATVVGAAAAWLIVLGWGLLAVAVLALVTFYFMILARWERGIYGLLIFLPFCGLLTLVFYPWRGAPGLNPVLYKDWLFVIPAYIGYLGARTLKRASPPTIGRLPAMLMGSFILLVLLQMLNPGVGSYLVALIGAKVWLFYIPLYPLTAALVTKRRDVIFLLRLLVVMAVVPCAFGIVEYVLARMFDYRTVMEAIYGVAAQTATQEFTHFDVAGGWIQRIPSTFSFVAQFFSFTLAMMAPCYALGRMDPSPRWRRFAQWMLVVAVVAALLSGVRAAFVFVPLLLALMYGLDRGFGGAVRVGVYVAAAAGITIAISRVIAASLYDHIAFLFVLYAEDTAYGGLLQAITSSPLGSGTGTNTGAARYAIGRPELFISIENYYAKVTFELGVLGLLLVWVLFAALIWQGWKAQKKMLDTGLRTCAATLVAFLIALTIYSFKGSFIDLDPLNVYFWMFAGLLAKLPSLDGPPGSGDKAAL
ncbi:MAG: hypothetical protein GZ088_07780 [Acidipila sp.]|nr:hypothetical protein [Acidipila sp.]